MGEAGLGLGFALAGEQPSRWAVGAVAFGIVGRGLAKLALRWQGASQRRPQPPVSAALRRSNRSANYRR